jgi:hypothetical protein
VKPWLLFLLVLASVAFSAVGCGPPNAAVAPETEAAAEITGLATLVPEDTTVLIEAHELQDALESVAPGVDAIGLLARGIASELGVSQRSLAGFIRSIQALGFVARLKGDLEEGAAVVRLSRVEPVDQLLHEELFVEKGDAPRGGKRFVLSDTAPGPVEVRGSDPPIITLYAEAKLLVIGTPKLAKAIADVHAGRGASLATSARYQQAHLSMPAEAILSAYFDVATAIAGDADAKSLLDTVLEQRTPVVATFRLKPQQRFSLSFGLSGSAMPDAKLFVPPPRLDLANRLPAETIFYTSYASNFGLSGRQLADALVSFFSSLDEDVPGAVRSAEKSTGVNRVKLLDAIGEQGVFALIAPTVVQPRGEDTFDQFAFLAVQEVASDGASGKVADALVDGFFKELAQTSNMRRTRTGFIATNRVDGFYIEAHRIDGHLVLDFGAPGLVRRSVDIFSTRQGTLKNHAAHRGVLERVTGSQVVTWMDTPRAWAMMLETMPAAGRRLEMLRRFGDPELQTGAFALAWTVEDDLWKMQLDLHDVATMGLVAALGMHGVRGYLARSRNVEAIANLDAMTRSIRQAYERNGKLCKAALVVPARGVPAGKKYLASKRDGVDYQSGDAQTGWKCLGFAINEPQYYSYGYSQGSGYIGPPFGLPNPGPHGFEVAAVGDLDDDGDYSVFTRVGLVDRQTGELYIDPEVYSMNELE